MGCRTPIRQMPVSILFSKDCVFFGKSEFANPLTVLHSRLLRQGFI
ncbi:MAG TPA: hypothetical protein PLJ85_05615 [Candidatus Cloacimonas sp.]|nr:hypothetical protein [Candidatus Cloacimonas sp.]